MWSKICVYIYNTIGSVFVCRSLFFYITRETWSQSYQTLLSLFFRFFHFKIQTIFSFATNTQDNNKRQQKSSFYEEKSLVGLTPVVTKTLIPTFLTNNVILGLIACCLLIKNSIIMIVKHFQTCLMKVSRIQSIPLDQNKFENNSGGKIHRCLHYIMNEVKSQTIRCTKNCHY